MWMHLYNDHGSEFIFEALSLENCQASKRKTESPLTEPYQQINGKTEKKTKKKLKTGIPTELQ